MGIKILSRWDGSLLREVDSTSLYGANLSGADLSGANLSGASLSGANIEKALLSAFLIVPQEGAFIGWKKLYNKNTPIIAKLGISRKARRTSTLVGRKCRAEYAKVLWLSEGTEAYSQHDPQFKYTVGKIVRPDCYNDDIRVECSNGIHFFITKQEAVDYV